MSLRPIRPLILSIAAVVLASCALGVGTESYRLMAPEVASADTRETGPGDRRLAISRPEADRSRDSTRILVRRGRSLMPWANAAWIDRAPEMLQGLLVEFLDGRVATVGRAGSLPAQHRLDLVLRRFELVESGDELEAELVMVARLFAADGRLLDVNVVDARTASTGGTVDDAVGAMESSIAEVFAKLAEWLEPRLDAARNERPSHPAQ